MFGHTGPEDLPLRKQVDVRQIVDVLPNGRSAIWAKPAVVVLRRETVVAEGPGFVAFQGLASFSIPGVGGGLRLYNPHDGAVSEESEYQEENNRYKQAVMCRPHNR